MINSVIKKYWLEDRFHDPSSAEQCFSGLLKHYGNTKRYYHNLDHLKALFVQWEKYRGHLQHPDLIRWAIFYHDVVYDVSRKDNESASAIYAQGDFTKTDLSKKEQAAVLTMILATEQHHPPEQASRDLLYFLDFDLSILGAERGDYQDYAQKVKLEYAIFPEEVYRFGRQKVLEQLLAREYLYQTDVFSALYEAEARRNLKWELDYWRSW